MCMFHSFFTEQGKILKVLHTIEEAFIISQYSLFHNAAPIINMAIDSQRVCVPSSVWKTYVFFPRKQAVLKSIVIHILSTECISAG